MLRIVRERGALLRGSGVQLRTVSRATVSRAASRADLRARTCLPLSCGVPVGFRLSLAAEGGRAGGERSVTASTDLRRWNG